MAVSVFDLFKIGIGPSSSHTVGPMRAARAFLRALDQHGLTESVARVSTQLYGSLGATGKGHGSDKAVLLGLSGYEPETVDTDRVPHILEEIYSTKRLPLGQTREISFVEKTDLQFYRKALPFHANGMRFTAFDQLENSLWEATYYSVGGGFIVSDEVAADGKKQKVIAPDLTVLPHPFHSCAELLELTKRHGITIAEIMRRNERHWRTDEEIDFKLLEIWGVMKACVTKGCRTEGTLPGGFGVKRRAAKLSQSLGTFDASPADPLRILDWVTLFALAVSEENAAGGRVVTAPTNGAAAIIPAVLHYYMHGVPGANERGVIDFLLTAAAIGILYKENASISGAEVGCQGEVGVACSMAAGALCAVLGGKPEQVENAAEIGMEHHLGLTCDPVGGLVQIPCIERNAVASVTAINAARMALQGDGTHYVSLDKVIKTMRETGADMLTKYKETARGGLAVNIVEC
ncbi:serine dehydratase [Burkholderia lata]|uniref:L-serine dehydratase n=1 Tax=Burkholderia lata (strain ATCC 17760 / DSM 23089 / LMG 22485 / NCIMB 9086 / R18194 / 383) TaxID=482957 RepID=A0A6P2UIY3_BURL3|nr:L-serine ammonia-lyase [Burkholderia lata]VWC76812.1 serine dehydratase [Burkholderia lata]